MLFRMTIAQNTHKEPMTLTLLTAYKKVISDRIEENHDQGKQRFETELLCSNAQK